MKYTYTFSIWPNENKSWPRALFTVFTLLNTRVCLEFTEEEWKAFRSRLEDTGFTVRAITRIPWQKPEVIL